MIIPHNRELTVHTKQEYCSSQYYNTTVVVLRQFYSLFLNDIVLDDAMSLDEGECDEVKKTEEPIEKTEKIEKEEPEKEHEEEVNIIYVCI